MRNYLRMIAWIVAASAMLCGSAGLYMHPAYALEADTLKKSIEEKAKELAEINAELQKTQQNLNVIENKGKTLSQEVKKYDYQIQQINLGIKSSEIKISKYGLEIESLGLSIAEKAKIAEAKRGAIAAFIRQLEAQERESMLISFLKSKSLADTIFETRAIAQVNEQLHDEVRELESVKEALAADLSAVTEKKHGIEEEGKNLKSQKQISEEQKKGRTVLLAETKNQEKIYQQQLLALEKMQKEISAEIEKIEAELRKGIDPNLLPLPRPGVLLWPVPKGVETQGYGGTSFALKTYNGKWHNGIDIGAPLGSSMLAAEDGVVINAGDQDKFCKGGAYGRFVVIKHTNGLTTLYGHMASYIVSVGQTVSRGQLIGYLGKTGWATGPHLHFTVFATQTITPAKPGFPEGTQASKTCGPMPVGGDLNPKDYL